MRITFDISAAVHHHAGLGRYAHELLTALTSLDAMHTYQAFFHANSAEEKPDPPLDRMPAHRMSLSAKPWRMSVLLATLAGVKMDRWLPRGDVFHATEHLLPPLSSCRTVFTIHDLIFRFFPEYHLPLNRWYLSLMLPRFMRDAGAIIAVSEHTRRDVSRLMGVPLEKITVIYEGVNPAFRPIHDPEELARVKAKYRLPEHFILCLSTIEPRKNVAGLLQAYRALLDRDAAMPDLIVAGRKGWLYEPVFQAMRDLRLEGRVRFIGWIADADAPALLNLADVFVYPSLYEGFGLPPLEAMGCGTSVVCSNAASLPEVVGDAAILFDPRAVNEMADAIALVLCDPLRGKEMRAKALARAAQFTWERAARETLRVYERLMREKGPARAL